MRHKRFWGKDMNEALRAVRSALGADALIGEAKKTPNASDPPGTRAE